MSDLHLAAVLPFVAAGAGVGFLIGLTGVAGASLMTPLLISTFGISPEVAVGTDLIYASITKAGAVWRHYLAKHLVWRLVLTLALGSIPASLLLIAVLALAPRDTASLAQAIRLGLGIVLPLSALAILFGPFLMRRRGDDSDHPSRSHMLATVALGAALGFAVTLTSVGAGAIGVPVLATLYPVLAAKRVVGTDIAHACALALVAGLGHAGLGHVDLKLLLPLLAGSIPGMLIGSSLCDRAPEWLLRPILAVTLCYAAYTLFN